TAEEALAQIAAEVQVCTRCPLHIGTHHAVPGAGSAQAEVMLIGEAPGQHEDRQGLPFVGQAGGFLDELLALAGLERSQVFIANVVKHRPPQNRDPQPGEMAACGDYLTRQIAAINPRVIVTLGRYSMMRFFPNGRISHIHGQASVIDGRVVVPMFHPAAALHQEQYRQPLLDDFRTAVPAALKAARELAATPAEKPREEEPPRQQSLF
ncbi:MAG TPA: uracil-DNA glycosylase, partial [Ktedonobacterales bacterium]|nr:uracil-DNA glycosylase [Ktedonobacterales bacterium]